MINSYELFNTLFDTEKESTCLGHSVYTTALTPLVDTFFNRTEPFFSINPMTGKRADANVTAFRNILIEFDGLPPQAQLEELKDVPYSTLVWSGGKSFHAIISLETPMPNRRSYDALVRCIQKALPDMDTATSNPSRFSRTPGVVRDNGNMQELIEVRSRVSAADIENWLGPAPVESEDHEYDFPEPGYISPWTKSYLRLGSEEGKRNRDLFKAACDLTRAGYDFNDIMLMTMDVHDLSEREAMVTIRSAIKAASGGK